MVKVKVNLRVCLPNGEESVGLLDGEGEGQPEGMPT